MADSTITVEDLRNLLLDAQALEKFINDAANVANPGQDPGTLTTRRNQTYKNLQRLIAEIEAANANRIEIQSAGTAIVSSASVLNFGAGFGVTVDPNDPDTAVITASGGSGGVPRYFSPSELRGDITDGTLANTDQFMLGDVSMRVNRALDDDVRSWLWNVEGDTNLGVAPNGVVPENMVLFTSFLDQINTKIFHHISADGINFNAINSVPIPRGGGNSTIGARDPDIRWVTSRNRFTMLSTTGSDEAHDFGYWDVSATLELNGFREGRYGASGIRGTTLPGGQVPATRIWTPKLRRIRGQWWIFFAAEYGAQYSNPVGGTSRQFQPFMARVTDINNLTTEEPIRMQFPIGSFLPTDGRSSMLTPDIIDWPGSPNLYAAIKGSFNRNILIYRNTELTGDWTLVQTIDQDGGTTEFDSLEGPLWLPIRYRDPADNSIRIKLRLMISDNRDENDDLVQRYLFTESLTGPEGTFGALEELNFSYPTRNGGLINLAMEDDPRAFQGVQQAVSMFGGHTKDRPLAQETVTASQPLFPRQSTIYTYAGSGGITLTVTRTESTRFWVRTTGGGTVAVQGANVVNTTIGSNGNEMVEFLLTIDGDGNAQDYQRVGIRPGTGTGTADGVVDGVSFDEDERVLTLTRSEGAALTETIPNENEPIVIGIAGQSNPLASLQATDGDKGIDQGTFAWQGTTTTVGTAYAAYEFGTYPLNRGTSPNFANNMGLQAANLLKQATGRDVYVIQLAEGGRRIEPFIQPATRTANGWTNLGGADIAPFFYDQIEDAIAAVPGRTTLRLDQFIWQQGENNSDDTQAEYQAKLQALRNDMIAANLIDPNHGSFTIGGLVEDHPYYNTHRAAAEAVEAAFDDVVYVNSIHLADVGDDVHFTGDALDALAIRHVCQGNQVSGLFPHPFSKRSGQNVFMLADNGFRVARRNRAGALSPYAADQPVNILGVGNDAWKGLALALQDTNGEDTGTPLRLFLGEDEIPRLGAVGQNGVNSVGSDFTNRMRFLANTQTSGTITWDRSNGAAVNNSNSGLTGTLTLSAASLRRDEMCVFRIGNPNNRLLQITPPSGTTIDWAQGAPLTSTTNRLQSTANACMITLVRVGASNVMGIYTEFGATA